MVDGVDRELGLAKGLSYFCTSGPQKLGVIHGVSTRWATSISCVSTFQYPNEREILFILIHPQYE